jgi:hypothetical protein
MILESDSDYPYDVCRYCGDPIIWAHTPTGKRMPINRDPVDLGNVRLVDGDEGLFAIVTMPARIPEGERYISHFASCAFASEARKVCR